jgi:hypothetical protein
LQACATHWLPSALQSSQAMPAVPHAILIVPGRHVPPWQQPVGQLVTSHAVVLEQEPETHVSVPMHGPQVPHAHEPDAEQLSARVVSHATQAAPPVPHVASARVWQVPPMQQPIGQLVASQAAAGASTPVSVGATPMSLGGTPVSLGTAPVSTGGPVSGSTIALSEKLPSIGTGPVSVSGAGVSEQPATKARARTRQESTVRMARTVSRARAQVTRLVGDRVSRRTGSSP